MFVIFSIMLLSLLFQQYDYSEMFFIIGYGNVKGSKLHVKPQNIIVCLDAIKSTSLLLEWEK